MLIISFLGQLHVSKLKPHYLLSLGVTLEVGVGGVDVVEAIWLFKIAKTTHKWFCAV